eukprot:Hpha_TRINITY_DN16741_c1_g1::TRINITY_DN16741_c1_g1_i7::g.78333::m.78333
MFLLSLLMVASASVAPNATVNKSLKNATPNDVCQDRLRQPTASVNGTANGVSVKVSIQCWDAQGRDSRCMHHDTVTGTFDDMPSQLCLPLGVRQDSVVLVWDGDVPTVTSAGWCISSQTTIDTANNLFLQFAGYDKETAPSTPCNFCQPTLANGDCFEPYPAMGDFRYRICYQGLC